MNIIVLCGGLSNERDVSLKSGAMITAALRRNGHKAVLVDSFFGYQGEYSDPKDIFDAPELDCQAQITDDVPDIDAVRRSRLQENDSRIGDNLIDICRAADIVFMALHGDDGESGKLQALFEIEGIRFTGCGSLGSMLAMNKGVAKDIFVRHGILTPDGITVMRGDSEPQSIGFPCVVKPRSGGSSVGTSVVESEDDYRAALDFAFKYDEAVIVEKYIKGREVDVGVLAGRALEPIEIRPKSGFFDYKNKYQDGMTDEICPTDFSAEIIDRLKETALDVFGALMLEVYARMDFIVDSSERIWCLEANTLPGMTPASLFPKEAAFEGMSYEQMCEAIIAESLKKY